jgi:hypothetical protein
VSRCFCPRCPVQSNSRCVKDKLSRLTDPLTTLPGQADMPGGYCSTGAATCQDIDTSEICSCFGCPVNADHNLTRGQPTCYFCVEGVAR